MNIVMLGPQGSGKGTQAGLLCAKKAFFHMEAGKMLREEAKKDPGIKKMIDNGLLIPDNEVINMMEKLLLKENDGNFDNIVFDGFPRTVSQYILLKKWLFSKKSKIDIVVYLSLSDSESIRRISERRVCAVCGENYNLVTKKPKLDSVCDKCGGKLYQRDDDRPKIIENRLKIYRQNTFPILNLAREDGILREIDGSKSIQEVEASVAKVLNI